MATVGGLIRSALKKIGVLASGDALPSAEGDDALETFRQMIEALANESLLIPANTVIIKQLTPGVGEYTIGTFATPAPDPLPDNHIEAVRPNKIITSFLRDSSNTDFTLGTMTAEQYANISVKGNQSRPCRYYYRQDWPVATIVFDSVPNENDYLHLEVVAGLDALIGSLTLTTQISLPPGYERMLINSLAIDLAPEYDKEPSNIVVVQSGEGKKWLKRQNMRKSVLSVDAGAQSNIRNNGTYIINAGP